MVVYKVIDEFSRETGEKIKGRKVFDFSICDFTGEKIKNDTNPNTYKIDFRSNDPCFGDGEGERWLYDWKENIDAYDLYGQENYIFMTDYYGIEVFGEMVEKAMKELPEGIYSLDHLLRWSRGKMLEKVLNEGTYKVEQFLYE